MLRLVVGDQSFSGDFEGVAPAFRLDNSAGYFTDLMNYLLSVQCFCHAVSIHRDERPGPWRNFDIAAFDALHIGKRLAWKPADSVATLCCNDAPRNLELYEIDLTPRTREDVKLGAVKQMLYCFGQGLMTNYFERFKEDINMKYGTRRFWPNSWRFGAVIRNAFAHNGFLNISDPKISANWRGLSYDQSQNGREILHFDLWPGDLIYLLMDMEAER